MSEHSQEDIDFCFFDSAFPLSCAQVSTAHGHELLHAGDLFLPGRVRTTSWEKHLRRTGWILGTRGVVRLIRSLWTSVEIGLIFLIAHIKGLRQTDESYRGAYLVDRRHLDYRHSNY